MRILADKAYQKTYPQGLANLAATPNVTVRLLPVDTLAGGVLHAKWMLVNGNDSFVGSQNFDWTSISHNRECGLRVNDQRLGACMAQLFDYDWQLALDPKLSPPTASRWWTLNIPSN